MKAKPKSERASREEEGSMCAFCNKPITNSCDYVEKGKRCGRLCCDQHSTHESKNDVDFCREHEIRGLKQLIK